MKKGVLTNLKDNKCSENCKFRVYLDCERFCLISTSRKYEGDERWITQENFTKIVL